MSRSFSLHVFFTVRAALHRLRSSPVPDVLAVAGVVSALISAIALASDDAFPLRPLLVSVGVVAAGYVPLWIVAGMDAASPGVVRAVARRRRLDVGSLPMSELVAAWILHRREAQSLRSREQPAYDPDLGFVPDRAQGELAVLLADRAAAALASTEFAAVSGVMRTVPPSHLAALASERVTVGELRRALEVLGPDVTPEVLRRLVVWHARARYRPSAPNSDGAVADDLVAVARELSELSPLQSELFLRTLPGWSGHVSDAVAASRALL